MKVNIKYSNELRHFELYKSAVCHELKELTDLPFLAHHLKQDDVSELFERENYAEALYLLAMIDYISRVNDIPLCDRYDRMRACRLEDTLYPAGVMTRSLVMESEQIKEDAKQNAIPEFLRFNIVENEVRDVV